MWQQGLGLSAFHRKVVGSNPVAGRVIVFLFLSVCLIEYKDDICDN